MRCSSRTIIRTPFSLLVCVLSLACALSAQQTSVPAKAHWVSSTSTDPWVEMSIEPSTGVMQPDAITLNETKTFQVMDGFGGCFNELGWYALQRLDPLARANVLRALFSPDGANFTLGRVGMGANDFAMDWYSFDETPNDFTMKDFSIDRDRQALIPFIHAAMQYQPGLGIWGVPWSPPSWMKTNGAYKGGGMKDDPAMYAAYALYFSKYVVAYRAAGVHLYAVMPQNEPKYNNNIYPQAQWTGEQMNHFLRDYLGPKLKKDKVDVQIWQGTIVNDKLDAFILPVLDDPLTNHFLTGIAYQYAGQTTMLETHTRYPDKKIMQSETECYNGENSWQQGLTTFARLIKDTQNFAGSYFYWNTILNDDARSTWGWKQNSLVTVDRKSGEAHFNPEFYSMKHFSAAVLPGAHRIGVSASLPDVVAFKNPSGQIVLEFENDSKEVRPVAIRFDGKAYQVEVPALSMNTITLQH